ncbi:YggS family pyridoxal phosphate-dependent enzyme [Leptolyngbya sp. FACHB-711]|uniref:YggS family pyridoxal phosphate-dependent enzyme n=1 Tax=unclassified Leptolyngbya TaxID=2650499 RepID=UPI001682DC93|nr:YggS family pyridoxal phosphate-dependent enzyme [Cyanobacteria bacterium FACHB-502]MBD2022964.1 YggS family pyridoxal phosphate-dependent enzyme [Leptolyngbya sp. FACHB-711]
MNSIAARLTEIRQTLPANVRLIAVTKQVSIAAIRQAYEAGVRDFGESRIQEAASKKAALQDLPGVTWHLIGHLQANKAAKALQQFQWIHSIDSLKLAQRLDQLAAEQQAVLPKVCLQVKLLPDPSKFGWTVSELLADLPQLDQCRHLEIQGLMVIPPYGLQAAETQAVFDRARELAERIRQQGWSHLQMKELSMGMSDDYPLAIQAGSTMIRLGKTLFGDRASQTKTEPSASI